MFSIVDQTVTFIVVSKVKNDASKNFRGKRVITPFSDSNIM